MCGRRLRLYGTRVSNVCIVSPREPGQAAWELLDGIEVYRHPALPDASGPIGYALEYSMAIFWETLFVWRVFFRSGFDVVHVSNPPDILFLVGGLFKALFSKKLVFDHHDICPELYEAKFGRKGLLFWVLRHLERWSIKAADIVISTNEFIADLRLNEAEKTRHASSSSVTGRTLSACVRWIQFQR